MLKSKKLVSFMLVVVMMMAMSTSVFALEPIADGIDLGQHMPQPFSSSYNYNSPSFTTGVYLGGSSNIFNIQNKPSFTSAKQSAVEDNSSVKVSYQIWNISNTDRVTAKVKEGAWVNTSTSVKGFCTTIAKGDCKSFLAGYGTKSKASGTFNY